MSLVAYLEITDEELQPDAPILSSIGTRFRDNPIAIATRDSNAPWLNGVGASQLLTGSGNWTVPDDVFRVRAWLFGGGGGGGGASASDSAAAQNGSSGGSTTFGGSSASGGNGGRGATQDLGPSQVVARPGLAGTTRGGGSAGGQGATSRSSGTNGNPGQVTMTVISVTPGQTISYSCGSGGSGGAAAAGISPPSDGLGGSGANGFIYLEW